MLFIPPPPPPPVAPKSFSRAYAGAFSCIAVWYALIPRMDGSVCVRAAAAFSRSTFALASASRLFLSASIAISLFLWGSVAFLGKCLGPASTLIPPSPFDLARLIFFPLPRATPKLSATCSSACGSAAAFRSAALSSLFLLLEFPMKFCSAVATWGIRRSCIAAWDLSKQKSTSKSWQEVVAAVL